MKKTILVITNMFPSAQYPSYGIFVERTVQSLRSKNISVTVVSMRKVDRIYSKIFSYLSFWLRTNLHITFGQYDRIYIHQPLHSLFSSLPAALWRVPELAINFHGHDLLPITWRGEFLQRILRRIIIRVSPILVPSTYFAKMYSERFGGAADTSASVYYSGGIEDCYFNRNKSIPGARGRTALFLSRFVEGKGWRDFIDLAELLLYKYPDFSFLIAGEGPDHTLIREEISIRHIESRVSIVRAQNSEHNSELMRAAKYFIFPSKFSESLALVNLEAMASGCIVISSRFEAAEDYLSSNENGYLVDADNFAVSASKLISALEINSDLCTKISNNAANTATRFSEGRVSADLIKLLDLAD